MKKVKAEVSKRYIAFRDEVLAKYFVRHPLLSSIYYVFFSSKFRREQHSVLIGKVRYFKQLKSDKANLYTLIRNTHRLEKGLLMKPRRDVFALDFIGETVTAFEKVFTRERAAESQYKWFRDVLFDYFRTSGSHPVVDKFSKRFHDVLHLTESASDNVELVPYHRQDHHQAQIPYEEFYKLTKYRRSVRWFQDKKVPRDLLDKAILAACQSPTACNRQPFEYRIIDDPALLKEVIKLPMGVKGYAHNIPMLIVVVGNLDAYFDERDRHTIYIDASLANMTFMLALETLGLSSCSINWPDVEVLERKMEKLLALGKHQRPVMCMGVGYPDTSGKVAYSEKRSLEKIRRYNNEREYDN